MYMFGPLATLKFLFAFSLPAVFVLLSIVGGDRWDGYLLFAGLFTFAGAICMADVAVRPGKRLLAGILYLAVVGMLLLILP
jgi:hypothetical protein